MKQTSAVEFDFYFYLAMTTNNDNFSAQLARLFLKSDHNNFFNLAKAFPDMGMVAHSYLRTANYWEDLQKRVKGE